MLIKKMEISDSESVIQVSLALPQWFTGAGIELIRKDVAFQNGFLALVNGEVVGFLTFFVNQGVSTIGWMGVLPQFQKNGIGTALINELKHLLIKNNIRRIKVSTLGDAVDYPPYAKTRAFYRKNGFVDFEKIPHLDNPEQEEELVLALDL